MKKIVKNFAKLLAFCFLSLVVSQSSAFAQSTVSVDDNPLSRVLCNVYKITTGNAGKTFCAFAIVAAGVGFFTGKLNWGLLIALVLGISAIFGAPKIISAITGTSGLTCDTQKDIQEAGSSNVVK
ncbi:MAG: TrbC/VirB2 family protein [Rickettsiales bacterium]|nr:TrbC/VirB2 family protein [Rickettsiales bacterium]